MKMSSEEFKQFMKDQRSEILKYKWCLGKRIHHDPLEDMSMNELCHNWITRYAREFRDTWENKNMNRRSCKLMSIFCLYLFKIAYFR